jgi:imidazolonepropionase-like amidohydrolase
MLREFKNARFVDIEEYRYYPIGTRLLVESDRIRAVLLPGRESQADAEQVDLGGLAVVPGLFNTHCHIQLAYPSPLLRLDELLKARRYGQRQVKKNLADCLARGVLHVRDALQRDQSPTLELKKQIQAGELPGPRIHQAVLVAPEGGTFSRRITSFDRLTALMTGATLIKDSDPASGIVIVGTHASPTRMRAAVNEAIDRRGAQSIKFYDQEELIPQYQPGANIFRDAQLGPAADQARKRGVPCTMHISTAAGFRRGVRAGVTSLAHLPCDELLTEEDILRARDAGVILEPTVSIAYFMAWPLPGGAWQRHPLYRWMAKVRDESYQDTVETFWMRELYPAAADLPYRVEQGRYRLLAMIDMRGALLYWGRMAAVGLENLQDLYAAGVPVACGTDAGAVPISPAAVGLELRLLRLFLYGFGPLQSLKAATLTSAQAMGLDKDYGSLSVGKVADFVLLDGNPLEDPLLVGGRAKGLFTAGQLVFEGGKSKYERYGVHAH